MQGSPTTVNQDFPPLPNRSVIEVRCVGLEKVDQGHSEEEQCWRSHLFPVIPQSSIDGSSQDGLHEIGQQANFVIRPSVRSAISLKRC